MIKPIILYMGTCLSVPLLLQADNTWRVDDSVEAFHFETPVLKGKFVARDERELGKGYGRHGLRGLTFKGHDLHAPDNKVGGKRRHQGIFNLYRVYSATETFGALRDDQAEVKRLENGARLTWPATSERPVAIHATWELTGPAQIDVSIEATPTRPIKNFEILPATYVPVEMVKAVYLGRRNKATETYIRPDADSEKELNYAFYPLSKKARDPQENSGRIHSSWIWPSMVSEERAALPIIFAENDDIQIILFADSKSASAVCVTPTPKSGSPENWNKVEQHSALYFSLFCRDVEAGKKYTARLRFIVIDKPENPHDVHLELYGRFMRGE